MLVSAQALTVAMFGGVGTVWGPVIGAVILIPVGRNAHAEAGSRFPGIQGVIYGLAIVCVIHRRAGGRVLEGARLPAQAFGTRRPRPRRTSAPDVPTLPTTSAAPVPVAAARSAGQARSILEVRGLSK